MADFEGNETPWNCILNFPQQFPSHFFLIQFSTMKTLVLNSVAYSQTKVLQNLIWRRGNTQKKTYKKVLHVTMCFTLLIQQMKVDCSNNEVQDTVSVAVRLAVCYSQAAIKISRQCLKFEGKNFKQYIAFSLPTYLRVKRCHFHHLLWHAARYIHPPTHFVSASVVPHLTLNVPN
jgi:hypothetical protein